MEPPSPDLPATPSGGESPDAAKVTHAGDATLNDAKPFHRAPPSEAMRRFHHYEVCLREDGVTLHELGRGAMGVSYKARDVNLDTPVAIKVVNENLPEYLHTRERFRREARAAAQLRHPNVASVFHFGETPSGQCFYAMEFIEGETLLALVQRDGPLPAPVAIRIALQVTSALIAADERGLVHRDLKPANLMLMAAPASRPQRPGSASTGSSGAHLPVVKVIDFGLAKAATGAGAAINLEAPLTQEGGFLGTPGYASPEQVDGCEVDARSDIYSLGVTLWYLLTGKIPFAGRSFREIYDRQMHRPLPVAQLDDAAVPAPLVELLRSMLAADPSERPASPNEVYAELERCQEAIGGTSARARLQSENPADVSPGRKKNFVTKVVVLALLATALAGGAYLFLRPRESASTGGPAALLEKSIAVLPLEDLSADKSNGYFADGIQDDLLSSLAKIKELKVISRSSVMGYRNTATRNLREIGQQLGVAHILEGSVRRAPDRVLVNVALIDTRTSRQLWAEHYDRTLADALTLQGELATEIAAALHATLSPEEKARVEARPTANADAYVLYLRARDYHTRPTGLLQDYQAAERLYTQALALDPGFALAHARLATVLAYSYQNFQPTAENHDRARAEADAALLLQPGLGEGHLARGLCLYWTEKKYEAALQELEVAGRAIPGNAEIDLFSGAIRRRQGRWSQALASMRQALARDPRAVLIAREIMLTDIMLRDWTAAARDGERALALTPNQPMLQVEKSYVPVWASGDLAPLRTVLAAVPSGVDPDGEITFARWDSALLGRDFAAAEKAVASGAPETVETTFGAVLPKSYLLGCIALARGENEVARPLLEAACPGMETEVRNVPLDAFRTAHLGMLYALLGRKKDAVRLGRHAIELLPETKDAYYGPSVSGLLALIYARTGENAQALDLIERLLPLPAALSPNFEGSITLSDLRLRWQWDPLRGDPKFQKLLAGLEPKTVYK